MLCMWHRSNTLCDADGDYSAGPYSVTFSPLMTRQLLTIAIVDDNIMEMNEQFQLTISNSLPDRVTISDPSQTIVTIRDDDGNLVTVMWLTNLCEIIVDITVTFKKLMYRVDEDKGSAKPTLVLSNPSSTNITITVNTMDGSADGEWGKMLNAWL